MQAAFATHPYGFLITAGDAGSPHARLVQHVGIDDDLSVWIGTSPMSRKVRDIHRASSATYAVEDRASFAAVVLSGEAVIEASLEQRLARWTDGFKTFFPGGPGGDDFVLVHLVPDEIELIDFAHGVHPEPYGLMAQRFTSTPEGWVTG